MTKAPLFSGASQTPNNTELASIAAILHEAAGIVITPGKGSMVQSRLAKRLRALKMTDYASYIALVRSPEGAGEKRLMISALTTNVTNFFRENHHFEQLRDTALPQLVTKARAGDGSDYGLPAVQTGRKPIPWRWFWPICFLTSTNTTCGFWRPTSIR